MALADRDLYETPGNVDRSLLGRFCPWHACAFYLPVLWIVLRASAEARAGRLDGTRWVRASLAVLRAMESVGMHVRISGMDVLRALSGPAVFVANHMSTLETFVLPGIIQPYRPVTFVVKDSLVRYPVFGPIMRSRDPIVVGRSSAREDLAAVLRGGEERLARGTSIVVFPQTTRSPDVNPANFNTLAAKLAARVRVPLVPVALLTDAWGVGRLVKDFGPVDPSRPVRFRFGPPLAPEGRGGGAHEEAVRFIVENVTRWRQGAS